MKRLYGQKQLPVSSLRYVLEALIPYSDANIKLAFKPNAFFNDLENIDRQKEWQKKRSKNSEPYQRDRLQAAFHRARKKGLVVVGEDGDVYLTEKGRQSVQPYTAKKLNKDVYLMVIFDIPEDQRTKRRHLRLLLKELKFAKVQQSVWVTKYDFKELIRQEVKALNLGSCVEVYEAARIL
ncbi:MAG TPA: CRISPR-associated endonuclease Cas2 [Candidatus Limnocylindria bacterium]|nr:CRISPR-associated endonuclease Cas2 [Candidatus Limnocylindria bacterium]